MEVIREPSSLRSSWFEALVAMGVGGNMGFVTSETQPGTWSRMKLASPVSLLRWKWGLCGPPAQEHVHVVCAVPLIHVAPVVCPMCP